jgi:Sec-independent protein secretion pathway component TatC
MPLLCAPDASTAAMEAARMIHPALSPREVRRNFACLVWMGSVFAMGWSEVVVVLQPLLVHYGASNTQIGIVQGVLIATLPGMFLPRGSRGASAIRRSICL